MDASLLRTHVNFDIMQCLWRSLLKYMISNNMDYQLYLPVFLICECFFPSEDTPTMPPPSGHPKGWESCGRCDGAEKALQGQC